MRCSATDRVFGGLKFDFFGHIFSGLRVDSDYPAVPDPGRAAHVSGSGSTFADCHRV
jgi:hypothetical protein